MKKLLLVTFLIVLAVSLILSSCSMSEETMTATQPGRTYYTETATQPSQPRFTEVETATATQTSQPRFTQTATETSQPYPTSTSTDTIGLAVGALGLLFGV